jgi:hypothetical protein
MGPTLIQYLVIIGMVFIGLWILAMWQVMAWWIVGGKRLSLLKERVAASGDRFLLEPQMARYEMGRIGTKDACSFFGAITLTSRNVVFTMISGTDTEVPLSQVADVWHIREDRYLDKGVVIHNTWLVLGLLDADPIGILAKGNLGRQMKDPDRFEAELRNACGLTGQSETREA